MVVILVAPTRYVWAQSSTAGTLPAGAPSPSDQPGTGVSVDAGETGKGSMSALTQVTQIFASVIQTGIQTAEQIDDQSDKFAGGLAVITIVFAGARFAATRDPVFAWLAVFEEVGVLGIFASVYVGYSTFAPGFCQWFLLVAKEISGADMSNPLSMMATVTGQLFDGIVEAFKGAHWYQYVATLVSMLPIMGAWLLLTVTTVIYSFFVQLGLIKLAAGAVMGKIALALGFSSFTRGYFKSWLDFMTSAGMYAIAAAILQKLVTGSLIVAINTAHATGVTTPYAGALVENLAFYMLLLSFEIPKIASMFGTGQGASGAALGKLARAVSPI